MAQIETYRNALKPGQRVLWYEIEGTLGQGGFGITYVARDTNLKQPVALKEFLPSELAVREGEFEVHPLSNARAGSFAWGLEKFMDEARTLAHFDHPNIVKVYTVFEANNTAYMVMRYEDGLSLGSIYSKRRRLPERLLQHLVHPLLDGLETVHDQGFIHRDIKPDNIYLRQDGSPVLIDFGSARIAVGSETRALTSLVTPGYAPFEQYVTGSDRQGPWSDIYSLGATLYRGIAGIAPPDATNRSEALSYTGKDVLVPALEVGHDRYSEPFLSAVDAALAFRYDERPQNVVEWRRMFRARRRRKGRQPRDVPSEEVEAPKVRAAEFAAVDEATPARAPTAPLATDDGALEDDLFDNPFTDPEQAALGDAAERDDTPPAGGRRWRAWLLAAGVLLALGAAAWFLRDTTTPGVRPSANAAEAPDEARAPPPTVAVPASTNPPAATTTTATTTTAAVADAKSDAATQATATGACAAVTTLPRLPSVAERLAAGADIPRYVVETISLHGPDNSSIGAVLAAAGGAMEARRATLAAAHGDGNQLSANDIEALAELLTGTLQDQGLLATAIAPMQYLDQQRLALAVLPWRLGEVRLRGVPGEFRAANEAVTRAALGATLRASLEQAPHAHALKRALLDTLLDPAFHGSAFAVLEPAARQARFDVVLKWQDAKPAFDPATVDIDRLYIYAVAGSGARLPLTQLAKDAAATVDADLDAADYAAQVLDLVAPPGVDADGDCRRDALLAAYRSARQALAATPVAH
ncbi:MAG: protein kinase [Gammaproteobacteria bacterium]